MSLGSGTWDGNAEGLSNLLEENKRLKELAERQMNDAEAARLELAEARREIAEWERRRNAPDLPNTASAGSAIAPAEVERFRTNVQNLVKRYEESNNAKKWVDPGDPNVILTPLDKLCDFALSARRESE